MKDLTEGKEGRLIAQFALPMIIGNIFQQLYNVVDSVIVGKYVGENALAAVGASFPIIFALVALAMGLGMGGSVILGQYFGAKDYEKVKKTSDTLTISMFIASVILGAIGFFCAVPLFKLMSLPEELYAPATAYLRVIMIGMPAFFCYNTVSSILRGLGDSKNPLYFLIFSTILNAILAVIFVLYLKWGVEGAAFATLLASLSSWILAMIYVNKTHSIIKYSFKNFSFDKEIFKKSVQIGLPSGIQQLSVALGAGAMMGVINRFGVNIIASYTAASRIDALAAMPAMNFAMALSNFTAQNIGANKHDRVKRGLKATILYGSIFTLFITAINFFFGNDIMRLFVDSSQQSASEIIANGRMYLVIVSPFYIVFSAMFAINGLLRGAGAMVAPMINTILSLWIFRVPLAYSLSPSLGYAAIPWAIVIGWSAGLIGTYYYYRTNKWKNRAIIKREN